jgi:hypothetical protein
MVVEGDEVRASLTPVTPTLARIAAEKADATPVLTGTASVGRDEATELDERRRRGLEDPGQLYIVDQLEIGMRVSVPEPVVMGFDDHNGSLYPFTLAQKLERITERSSWYLPDGDSPWGSPDRADRDDQRDRTPLECALPGAGSGDRVVHRSGGALRRRPGLRRPALSDRAHAGRDRPDQTGRVVLDRVDAHRRRHRSSMPPPCCCTKGVFKASFADYPT